MCLAQGQQRSDAGEAGTRGLSISSQALYHRATALPICCWYSKHMLKLMGEIIFTILCSINLFMKATILD